MAASKELNEAMAELFKQKAVTAAAKEKEKILADKVRAMRGSRPRKK